MVPKLPFDPCLQHIFRNFLDFEPLTKASTDPKHLIEPQNNPILNQIETNPQQTRNQLETNPQQTLNQLEINHT